MTAQRCGGNPDNRVIQYLPVSGGSDCDVPIPTQTRPTGEWEFAHLARSKKNESRFFPSFSKNTSSQPPRPYPSEELEGRRRNFDRIGKQENEYEEVSLKKLAKMEIGKVLHTNHKVRR